MATTDFTRRVVAAALGLAVASAAARASAAELAPLLPRGRLTQITGTPGPRDFGAASGSPMFHQVYRWDRGSGPVALRFANVASEADRILLARAEHDLMGSLREHLAQIDRHMVVPESKLRRAVPWHQIVPWVEGVELPAFLSDPSVHPAARAAAQSRWTVMRTTAEQLLGQPGEFGLVRYRGVAVTVDPLPRNVHVVNGRTLVWFDPLFLQRESDIRGLDPESWTEAPRRTRTGIAQRAEAIPRFTPRSYAARTSAWVSATAARTALSPAVDAVLAGRQQGLFGGALRAAIRRALGRGV